jgi:hypothetical protein
MRSEHTLGDRLVSALAAVVLAVPTSFVLWFAVNLELASFGPFLESFWLWGVIALFILISVASPHLFVRILGAIWSAMHGFAKWFH